jgi:hypothetical protein
MVVMGKWLGGYFTFHGIQDGWLLFGLEVPTTYYDAYVLLCFFAFFS